VIQGGVYGEARRIARPQKNSRRLKVNPMPIVSKANENDVCVIRKCDAGIEVLYGEPCAHLPDQDGRSAIEI
jgi:hypothetical protein